MMFKFIYFFLSKQIYHLDNENEIHEERVKFPRQINTPLQQPQCKIEKKK